jgi:hypothetical protein
MLEHKEGLMKTTESLGDFVVIHALDPEDASAIVPMRAAGRTQKGVRWRIDARKFFDADYRLAPEHPFPAAVDDVLATYRGMDDSGIRRIAITGDSAGGNPGARPCFVCRHQSGTRQGHSCWSGCILARH